MVYKRHKSNFISLFYAIIFFAFASCTFAIVSSNQSYVVDTWQNYASFDFEQKTECDEKGKEITVIYISTPEQLAGAFQLMNDSAVSAEDYTTISNSASKIYKLSSNVNLSGKSWSSKDLPSDYTFDGNSFTISNLSTSPSGDNIGFISINSGTIQNLYFSNITITNGKTDGTSSNTGAVCGKNVGTIKYVTVTSGSIQGNAYKDNSDREVGGICGRNEGTVFHCYNYAKVFRGKHFGGIVGFNSGSISECYNYGKICDPFANQYTRIGGISGESSGSVSLCINFGEVNGYYTSTNSADNVTISDTSTGGIVGYCGGTISKCGNYGAVSSGKFKVGSTEYQATNSYVGGVAGRYANSSSIDSCYNQGNVTGYAKSNSDNKHNITQKTNRGETEIGFGRSRYNYEDTWYRWYYQLTANTYKLDNHNSYVGGIVGYSDNKIKMLNCYSTGSLSGGYDSVEQSYSITVSYKDQKGRTKGILWWEKYVYDDLVTRKTQNITIKVNQKYMLVHPICGNNNFTESNCYYSNVSYGTTTTVTKTGLDTTWSANANVITLTPEESDDADYVKKYNYIKNIRVSCSNSYFSIEKYYCYNRYDNYGGRTDNVEWTWGQAVDASMSYGVPSGSGYSLQYSGYSRTISTTAYATSVNLGSAYTQDSSKNGGYHYFKDLYW